MSFNEITNLMKWQREVVSEMSVFRQSIEGLNKRTGDIYLLEEQIKILRTEFEELNKKLDKIEAKLA